MREVGRKQYFEKLRAAFDKNIMDHIAVYGPDNDKRLTGKHETAPWNKFSYGVADRGASVRVPHSFMKNDYKGYLEDRRPNSQGDPYAIASQILKTISEVPTAGKMLGGNSAFAHIGTYQKEADGTVDIMIQTVRHNPDPAYRAMAGTDDATLLAKGTPDGDLYRFAGHLKELPGAVFSSVMTP